MPWFETRAMRLSRVKNAIANYPFYDRPHKQKPKLLRQAQDNFDYFMRVRLHRLEFFQGWLQTHFDVNPSFNGDGASAVSRWLDRYGEALLSDDDRDQYSFPYYSKSWTKENPTYSVIFDLGIFVGEFVIEKRPWCHWALMQETPDKPSIKKSLAKLKPALFFQPKGDPMAPIDVAWFVLSDRRSPGTPTPRAGKGELVRWIKQFMYNARATDEDLVSFSLRDVDRESFDKIPMTKRN
jgi:hypothetical protein